jgi:hypothetical protein
VSTSMGTGVELFYADQAPLLLCRLRLLSSKPPISPGLGCFLRDVQNMFEYFLHKDAAAEVLER